MASMEEQHPASHPDSSEHPKCWICFGEGPHDELGQPLIHDCCSCRNSNGCLHLSCAVTLARTKSKEFIERNKDGDPLWYWSRCPTCRQFYTKDVAVGLATELVAIVKMDYPDNEILLFEALALKVCVLYQEHWNIEDIKQTANEILSLTVNMEMATKLQLNTYYEAKADAFNVLGTLALWEGTEESLLLALEYFEKARDAWKASGDETGTISAELNIADAKSGLGGGGLTIEQEVEKLESLYKTLTREWGEGDSSVIWAGVGLVEAYKEAEKTTEANALLKELADDAHRVHGANHDLTSLVQSHQS